MNKLFLIGNLTKDPETRTTPNGKTVCNFDIAVNDRQGNATYFHVSAWNKLAETCQTYLQKGKKVMVCGPVSARGYSKSDGTVGVSLEINANEVEFLSPREDGYEPQMTPVQTDELPF